jgi:LacI family transcriptional regulator
VAGTSEFVLGLNPVIQRADEQRALSTQALARYLTLGLNVPVRIVAESNYTALIEGMRAGDIDAALLGEYAFYVAQLEAGAEALAVSVETGSNEAATYQSVIVARADSRLHTLTDLRGETVGFVERNSTAGYLIPRRMLREAGLDPDRDITPAFSASHRGVAEAVLAGDVAAGALHGAEFARVMAGGAVETRQLRTIAMSPPIPKGPFAVRRGLDRELRQRLLQALLVIHAAAPIAASLILSPGTHWRPTSNRHVTIKTIAALSGVSYGTVSRVINGRAHVAPETQARVMSIVADLGYRPNAAAVSLIANRSDLIGFVVPDVTDPAIGPVLAGLQRVLGDAGMRVVLCPVDFDREQETEYLGLLDDGRFGGLVLTEWSRETSAVSTLAAAGRALVLVGVTVGNAPIPSVAPNGDAIAAAAVAYLHDVGHVAIQAILPPWLCRSFERQFAALGLDAAAVHPAPIDAAEVGHARAQTIFATDPRPTAVICGTERIALGAIQAAAALGIAVPAEASIIALGETWLATAATPPLTTVASSPEALGERAAELLIEQISGGERASVDAPAPDPIVTPRGSTAPPAQR